MKVHQTTSICPRLKPVQLPLVGKCLSINSATRIFCKKAMMTGISSVRSWVIVMCSLIPRAYLNAYFLAKIRTNCELSRRLFARRKTLRCLVTGYDVEGSITICYPVAFQDWLVSVLRHLGIRVCGADAQGGVDVMAR